MRHDDDKGKEQNRDQNNNNCVRHVVDKNSAFRARYEVSLANFITNVQRILYPISIYTAEDEAKTRELYTVANGGVPAAAVTTPCCKRTGCLYIRLFPGTWHILYLQWIGSH